MTVRRAVSVGSLVTASQIGGILTDANNTLKLFNANHGTADVFSVKIRALRSTRVTRQVTLGKDQYDNLKTYNARRQLSFLAISSTKGIQIKSSQNKRIMTNLRKKDLDNDSMGNVGLLGNALDPSTRTTRVAAEDRGRGIRHQG